MTAPDAAPRERKKTFSDGAKFHFVLSGFSQAVGQRVFAFEGVCSDGSRDRFTVSADLSLSRRYGIRLQELPLLCRAVLDRCHDGGERREYSYTEEQMQIFADGALARESSAKSKKPPRRPGTDQAGTSPSAATEQPMTRTTGT